MKIQAVLSFFKPFSFTNRQKCAIIKVMFISIANFNLLNGIIDSNETFNKRTI